MPTGQEGLLPSGSTGKGPGLQLSKAQGSPFSSWGAQKKEREALLPVGLLWPSATPSHSVLLDVPLEELRESKEGEEAR